MEIKVQASDIWWTIEKKYQLSADFVGDIRSAVEKTISEEVDRRMAQHARIGNLGVRRIVINSASNDRTIPTENIKTKFCSGCGTNRPITEFSRSRTKVGGVQSMCKRHALEMVYSSAYKRLAPAIRLYMERNNPASPTDIAEAIGFARTYVRNAMTEMVRRGELTKLSRGLYVRSGK